MSGSPITFEATPFNAIALISIIFNLLIVLNPIIIFLDIVSCLFLIGFLLIIPIGGADMRVVILELYSGWAAAGIGFTLENTALIITGALVGSYGDIIIYHV